MGTEPRQEHDLARSRAQMMSMTGCLHVAVHDWEIRLELVVQGEMPYREAALLALDGQTAQITLVRVD